MLDVLDHFLWTLRREGFAVSIPQAIDVARAAAEVGFSDRASLREAIACVVADSAARRGQFYGLFDRFFDMTSRRPVELTERLIAQGFTSADLTALRELLREFLSPQGGGRLRALLTGGAGLDHLIATSRIPELLQGLYDPLKKGFYAQRALEEVGAYGARSALGVLHDGLADALGAERADLLVQALTRELERSEGQVRALIDGRLEQVAEAAARERGPLSVPFAKLNEDEMVEVRAAVRALAARLRGAASLRRRHLKRGRLDPGRTIRASMLTGGVPVRPIHRDQRRSRPHLVVLCDVSDSVRAASRFMLEFVYVISELFEKTRSFVFVNELDEVTRGAMPGGDAVPHMMSASGGRGITNYGRVFSDFAHRYGDTLDRRTTLIVLGDGRSNFQPHGAEVLGRLRRKAKSVLWLCPEPRVSWGSGDSAMPAFTKSVTQVFEVACARDLERAARQIVVRS